jgi:sigma-70-like protein
MQLRDWHGLSTSEAEEALGVPEGTLKAQLARGRAKLTQRLRKSLGMPGARTSNPDSKGRRKASPGARCRRDLVPGGVPMPVFGFEEQGGDTSWMSA